MISCKRRDAERGQAILLVVVAMGIVLLGALGFAIDGSQLFAQRRMAQAAADAAAQAGIMSMLDGTNTSGSHAFDTSSSFTCNGSDQRTPCYYAQTLNGFGASSDTVAVDFPTSVAGVTALSFIRVRVQRTVATTLMKFLGASVSTIGASATAAIVSTNPQAPQIIVGVRNSGSGVFYIDSGTTLSITGGANRVIQINSSDPSALSVGGGRITINLSGAGVNGGGADFAVWGGPNTAPFDLNAGVGSYVQPGSPMLDAANYVDSNPPQNLLPAPAPVSLGNGLQGCPASPPEPCKLYSPGSYTLDIYPSGINITDQTAVFKPGIYDLQGVSLQMGTNASMRMATGFTDDSTGTGMLLHGGAGSLVNFSTDGPVDLQAPTAGVYRGILISTDTLELSGRPSLTLNGSIITRALTMAGHPSISFTPFSTAPAYSVKQVALVN